MRIIFIVVFLFAAFFRGQCQSVAVLKKVKNQFSDSVGLAGLISNGTDFHYGESAVSTEEGSSSQAFVPSVLNAGRDLFASTAAFHFNTRRFRLKGFAPHFFQAFINDIPMNQLTDGTAPWSSWGGLNEVMSATASVIGLRDNDASFGSFGSATYIDLKASRLRAQTSVSTIISNRSYRYRFAFTNVVPFNKNGWAYAFSISTKMGEEVVVPGSNYHSYSYFLSVDKKWKDHLFSLLLIGAQLNNSRVSAITKEVAAISGSAIYSPGWGYQAGEKRNANYQLLHYPLLVVSHEFKTEDDIRFSTSLALSAGEKSVTALDWYNAADPRPDYYRYLPGFQTDSMVRTAIGQLYAAEPELLQINWNRLYEVNRNSIAQINDADGIPGNLIRGLRSRYILEDRVEQQQKFIVSSRVNQQVGSRLALMAGISYQLQIAHYFKRMNDLLGGSFYVDWNNFSEDQRPESAALQNDLNRPNRILSKGDALGYDYQIFLQQLSANAQLSYRLPKFDFFGGIELSEQSSYRNGLVRNGVFPLNSFGRSSTDRFSVAAFKAGITYKWNGRKYFFLNAGWMQKPPFVNDYYISPRTRDTRHPEPAIESNTSIEAGYILNAPAVKFRLNMYAAFFKHGMNMMSFYHDGYRNLVNYAIADINQLHLGMESAAEIQLSARFRANLALAFGKYTYSGRQSYSVSIDNEDFLSGQGIVYTNHFPVPGTPQQALNAGITYQGPDNLLLSIHGNFLASYWVSFNPLRRTYEAMSRLAPDQAPASVSDPEQLPDVFVADLSAAYSFRINKYNKNANRVVQLFLSVGNLLNQTMITGGYEQLRFDIDNANTNKFPSKYFYNTVANYSLSIRLRL